MSSKIRVAISGGGIAGASMLHALLEYPHIDTHIFESAPKFREAGVALGICRNASAALELIGPSATGCLERAGGVPMQGVCFFVAQGKDAGDKVFEQDNKVVGKPTTTIVQRADFLRELLANKPEDRMHASKKLETIDRQANGSILLHFADGSTHECDILIGADGIHSIVRKSILGIDDLAASPRNTGSWAIMTLQPYEKARASIGEAPVDIEDAREYAWGGDGTMMMHNLLGHGSVVQFAIFTAPDRETKAPNEWMKTVTADELKQLYVGKGWPSHLEKAVVELLCNEPEQRAMYIWEHPPARTYVDGPVCIVGDAAHATVPLQAAGGGMSIEDSLILSTLLGRAQSPKEALTALEVYDKVRRPRTQRIVESSYVTGRMITGVHEEIRLDSGRLEKALANRWDFILDFDNTKHREEALEMMKIQLGKAV